MNAMSGHFAKETEIKPLSTLSSATQDFQILWRMDEVTLRYIVLAFAVIPWILYVIAVGISVFAYLYSCFHLHKKSKPTSFQELPGVSIIKPLMGLDPYLQANLESHFNIIYPKIEILLCVQDQNDPAVALAEEIMKKYPHVDSKLLLGGKDGILNPMVNNMVPGYEASKHPLLWISTSKIQASTEILLDMVAKLEDPKVAIVHQLPFTADESGFADAIEKIYFGSKVARYYLSLNPVGLSCFTGMSYLVSKSKLEEVQGLASFGRYLAEDFFIAKFVLEKGYRNEISAIPAIQRLAQSTVVSYKDRMVRWLRLRMNMLPFVACFLEPMGECFSLGLYASWSAYHLFQINPYFWFIAHSVTWCICDYLILRNVQNGPLPFNKCTYIVAWLTRELLFFYIYFEALINVRHIRWGKKTYKLSNFGRTTEIAADFSLLPI